MNERIHHEETTLPPWIILTQVYSQAHSKWENAKKKRERQILNPLWNIIKNRHSNFAAHFEPLFAFLLSTDPRTATYPGSSIFRRNFCRKFRFENGWRVLGEGERGGSRAIPVVGARRKRRRATHPRWSLRRAHDYLLSAGELTTDHRWENRLPVERTARSLTTSLRGFNGHSNGTSSPRDAN